MGDHSVYMSYESPASAFLECSEYEEGEAGGGGGGGGREERTICLL